MHSYDVTLRKIQALMALPDYRRHMGYLFVNLFSEKFFKLSVLGVSIFDRIPSIFLCKPQLSLERLISVRFSRFEEYIFYDLT